MIRLVRPWRYPHREGRVYTSLGFRRRVVRALLRDGFTPREVQRLTDLYMGSRDLQEHQDDTGSPPQSPPEGGGRVVTDGYAKRVCNLWDRK